ncbi:CHASE3 domain-containing protein [Chamaesiphon sp. GL140_3_metabinner_50]|uniref:sensor histidine kinase n=1 Tax=Chamaesiphon sp. GL140_3_metabinner_50 TaxID=2970812 RepID=UPI0025EF58D9|nr:CHASE3 domain-containing protein [Chamaesiphon sp. GL140_3_metabinner_50]
MKSVWQKLQTYWHQLPIERRATVAISIPLACLLGAVVVYTLLRQRMVEAQLDVQHTNQVLAKSQNALISVLNAETGVRGYYISRDRLFLEPYDLAVKNLQPEIQQVERLVSDNPQQKRQAKTVARLAQANMNHLKTIIADVNTRAVLEQPVDTQRLLVGKQIMDRFRTEIARFEAEEHRMMVLRAQVLSEQQDFNVSAMWYGIALSLIGTAVSIRLIRELAQELRNREISLRESRSLVQAILGNIVDGAIVINSHGKIETFNQAATDMFGYTEAEVVGWDWQRLLSQDDEDTQKLLFYSPLALPTLDPLGKIFQAMGQHKNGEFFPIEISLNQIELDDDRIAIVRDITERQQTAAKLQAKAMEMAALNNSLIATNLSLNNSNQELDRFAYITSHDLKAPLRAIASLAEWIEEDLVDCLSPETRSHMQLLRRRVYRMQALLNSLLEYSRVGRTHFPITTVNVEELLQKVIQNLAPPATFAIEIVSPMPTIQTRQQPLEQVFNHLIDNAIRHHPTKMGIIRISALDLGDRYEFAIADDGDGIEPQYQTRIYTIFQTLQARDLQENVGAGLAIVKKIVTAEGGTIKLQSLAGKGAIFRFTWLKQPAIDKERSHTQV